MTDRLTSNERLATWAARLEAEELAFLRRFALASGSLKELAKDYGVSYPTIRARLNQLIRRIEEADEASEIGPLRALLRRLVREGALSAQNAKDILKAHESEKDINS